MMVVGNGFSRSGGCVGGRKKVLAMSLLVAVAAALAPWPAYAGSCSTCEQGCAQPLHPEEPLSSAGLWRPEADDSGKSCSVDADGRPAWIYIPPANNMGYCYLQYIKKKSGRYTSQPMLSQTWGECGSETTPPSSWGDVEIDWGGPVTAYTPNESYLAHAWTNGCQPGFWEYWAWFRAGPYFGCGGDVQDIYDPFDCTVDPPTTICQYHHIVNLRNLEFRPPCVESFASPAPAHGASLRGRDGSEWWFWGDHNHEYEDNPPDFGDYPTGTCELQLRRVTSLADLSTIQGEAYLLWTGSSASDTLAAVLSGGIDIYDERDAAYVFEEEDGETTVSYYSYWTVGFLGGGGFYVGTFDVDDEYLVYRDQTVQDDQPGGNPSVYRHIIAYYYYDYDEQEAKVRSKTVEYWEMDDEVTDCVSRVISPKATAPLYAAKLALNAQFDPEDFFPSSSDFDTYADIVYTYNEAGQVASITQKSCSGCGASRHFDFTESACSGSARDQWKTRRIESTRVGTDGLSGEGTVTTFYYNTAGQLLHRIAEDYPVDSTTNDPAVRTIHNHHVYDPQGNMTEEYALSGESFDDDANENDDGTFAGVAQPADGLIRLYDYDTTTGNLEYEKVKDGSEGTPVTVTSYEYYEDTDITRRDLVKRVTRDPDPGQSGDEEVTEYLYHYSGGQFSDSIDAGDFHDGSTAVVPKWLQTRSRCGGTSEWLVTSNLYDSEGNVTQDTAANGLVTTYAYETLSNGVSAMTSQERDPTGEDLTTANSYFSAYYYPDKQDRLAKTVSPSGQETYYSYEQHAGWTEIGDAEYWNVVEQRIYPDIRWDEGTSEYVVTGAVDRTFAAEGGPVLSRRTSEIAIQDLNNGVIEEPVGEGSVKDLSRTDYIYDESGRLVAEWVYDQYDGNGAVDTSHYLVREYGYHDDGRMKCVRTPYASDDQSPPDYRTYSWSGMDSDEGTTETWYKSDRSYTVSVSGETYTLVGPVQVTWTDERGRTVRSWTGTCTLSGEPDGSETLAELSRTSYVYDWRDRLVATRRYHNLPGSLDGGGTLGTNYYEDEVLVYDNLDRQVCQKDSAGKLTFTVYDIAGRAVETWVGQNLGSSYTLSDPNNGSNGDMVKVSETMYEVGYPYPLYTRTLVDGDAWNVSATTYDILGRAIGQYAGTTAGSGATHGDDPDEWTSSDLVKVGGTVYNSLGQVDSVSRLKPKDTVEYADAEYTYDVLSRQEWAKPDAGPWSKSVYDAAGQVAEQWVYENGYTSGDHVLAKTVAAYDALGRMTARKNYAVEDGVVDSDYLATEYFYDSAGRQCKVTRPQGGFSKTEYDAAGRVSRSYFCSDEGQQTAPGTLVDDIVLTETVYTYDESGRLAVAATYARNHDDTSTTGALSAAWADLGDGRVEFAANWYDALGRQTYTASYGTNGGTAITSRPASAPEPDSSDDVIVTKYEYNGAGQLEKVTDNKGIVTKREYDYQGRLTALIENYDAGASMTDTENRTTRYAYNAAGALVEQTADMPSGTDDQETKYVYSAELDDKGSTVKSNSLLRAVIYPDSDDDVDDGDFTGTYDRVEMTYYADGSLKSRTDQRGVGLTFLYDDTGRRTRQTVTSGTVDGDQRIDYHYDALGRADLVTTYSDTAGSTVTSQVAYSFNGFGQLEEEAQDHDSAVDGNSPRVQYAFDDQNHMRPLSVTYPSGRTVYTTYNGHNGIDNAVSRANGLATDSSSTDMIVQYAYLGNGMMVQKDYPTPDIRLTYLNAAGYDPYANLDRFGRIVTQHWEDYEQGSVSMFKIAHGYDRASNRLYAQRQDGYKGASQAYTYDDLHRLATFRAGIVDVDQGQAAARDYWKGREQAWTLDAVGNQTAVDDFSQGDWYRGAFNAANEYDDASGSRKVKGQAKLDRCRDDFTSDTSDQYEVPGSGDSIGIHSPISGVLSFTGVSQDTLEQVQEEEARAIVLAGEQIGPVQMETQVFFPPQTPVGGYVGLVFGYKGPLDYWMFVWEKINAGQMKKRVYHVIDGVKQLEAETAASNWAYNVAVSLIPYPKRYSMPNPGIEFTDGYPSGRIGLVTNIVPEYTQYARAECLYVADDALWADTMGRWANNTTSFYVFNQDHLITSWNYEGARNPILLRNLRVDRFQALFSVTLPDDGQGLNRALRFVFNAKDQDDCNWLRLYFFPTPVAPAGTIIVDGHSGSGVSATRTAANVPTLGYGQKMWVKITSTGTQVTVAMRRDDQQDWQAPCFSADWSVDGGMIGFAEGTMLRVDDLTVTNDGGDLGTAFNEGQATVQMWDGFDMDYVTGAGHYAVFEQPLHDAAGNLVYDGQYRYGYDAWNRQVKVERAYRDSSGDVQAPAVVGVVRYDGVGRRIVKAVTNSADWDATYHFYYNGQQMVEECNGSGQTLREYVWGLRYIDELVRTGLNQDPWNADTGTNLENRCERFFWVAQDANYNVLGVFNPAGKLIERYEYTPYGQRTVFSHGWLPLDLDGDGVVGTSDQALIGAAISGGAPADSAADFTGDGVVDWIDEEAYFGEVGRHSPSADALVSYPRLEGYRPYGFDEYGAGWYGWLPTVCEIGHQGLYLDKEWPAYYNRARMYHWQMMRMMQVDPLGYVDGMSRMWYCGASPLNCVDPSGEKLCLWIKNQREYERIEAWLMKFVRILAPSARKSTEMEKVEGPDGKITEACCIDVPSAGTLASQLIKDVADLEDPVIWIRQAPGQARDQYDRDSRIVSLAAGGTAQGWFSKDWEANPEDRKVELRRYPADDTERAARLAHELIHAYYVTLKQLRMSMEDSEMHFWTEAGHGSTVKILRLFGTSPEEEFYTTGISVVKPAAPVSGSPGRDYPAYRDRLRNFIRNVSSAYSEDTGLVYPISLPREAREGATAVILTYTAKYTENAIRHELKIPWRREAYDHMSYTATDKWNATYSVDKVDRIELRR